MTLTAITTLGLMPAATGLAAAGTADAAMTAADVFIPAGDAGTPPPVVSGSRIGISPLFADPSVTITKAEEARELAARLRGYIEYLRKPIDSLRYAEREQRIPPRPMMALKTTARFILQIDRQRLQGEAGQAYPNKKRDAEEARTLVLLNALYYENAPFLERYFSLLNNPSPVLLMEHFADLLFYEYRTNHEDLSGKEPHFWEKVKEKETTIDTYRELMAWMKYLFGEGAVIFGRRLAEHGFNKAADLLNRMEEQVRQAKKALAGWRHQELLRPRRAAPETAAVAPA